MEKYKKENENYLYFSPISTINIFYSSLSGYVPDLFLINLIISELKVMFIILIFNFSNFYNAFLY